MDRKGSGIDYYKELGVEKDASGEQIKAAYRQQSKRKHPDAGGDIDDWNMLHRAYTLLMDPRARKEYDETGTDSTGRKPPHVRAEEMVALALDTALNHALAEEIETEGWGMNEVDIIRTAIENMKANIQQIKKDINDHSRQRQALERKIRKVRYQGAGINRFDVIIKARIRIESSIINDLDAELEALRLAALELEKYEYVFEHRRAEVDDRRFMKTMWYDLSSSSTF